LRRNPIKYKASKKVNKGNDMKDKQQCRNFPFFGARYLDATCIDGRLYDLDKCDDKGNLYEPGEDWPCPFCRTEAFIKQYAESCGKKYKDVRVMVKSLKEKHLVSDAQRTESKQ
jgi:hypothetical protein